MFPMYEWDGGFMSMGYMGGFGMSFTFFCG